MRNTWISLGRRILSFHPALATLIIVGLFISLCANLLVAYVTASILRPVLILAASAMMLICALLLLPVVVYTERIHRDASARTAVPLSQALVQLLNEVDTETCTLISWCCAMALLMWLCATDLIILSDQPAPIVLW
jgi:hypothetical protein